MEETEVSGYWCHMCAQTVNPVREIESIKCPICESGFVEEMATASAPGNDNSLDFPLGGSDSDRALSLWAPILLGMMGNPRRRSRIRGLELEDYNESSNQNNDGQHAGEAELDRELESLLRRRRNSAAILQLLQEIRGGLRSEPGNSETDLRNRDRENERERDRERVILINPFNQTIVVQGSYGRDPPNHAPSGSLGDYFIGPGLDLLLQHLSENDPNRYGTPPAQKESVEALPTVKTEETMQCSICLDECEIGDEVRQMPCKHKFHSSCILPWLELHSSCPICRYQLPCDESKIDSESEDPTNNGSNSQEESNNSNNNGGDDRNENLRQFQLQLPWPFSSLFRSSITQRSSGGSSTTNIPDPSRNGPRTSEEDEN